MTDHKTNSERRLYQRIQVDLPAEIQIGGSNPVPCRIRDLCQNGLLLECAVADDDPKYQRHTKVIVRFTLPRPDNHERGREVSLHHNIQTWIELLQRGDGFFGARFLQLNAVNAAAIEAYLKTPLPHPPIATANDGAAKTALAILRRVTLHSIDDLIKPVAEAMRESLWACNASSVSDAERNDTAADIVCLEKNVRQRHLQEQIRREMLNAVLQPKTNMDVSATAESTANISERGVGAGAPPASPSISERGVGAGAPPASPSISERGVGAGASPTSPSISERGVGAGASPTSPSISLVDQDKFEIWLAASTLAERMERQLGEPLITLRSLSNGISGDDNLLAIEPQGLVLALRRALESIGISTQGQLACLRAVVKPLQLSLVGFYQTITEAWVKSGFTPTAMLRLQTKPIKAEAVKSLVGACGVPTSHNFADKPKPSASSGTKLRHQDNNDKLADPTATSPISTTALSQPVLADNILATPTQPPIISGRLLAKEVLSTSAALNSISAENLGSALSTWLGAAATPITSAADLQAKLATLLNQGGVPLSLPPPLRERVNTSEHVLTRMLDDEVIDQRVRAMLQKLAMRIMSIAVTLNGFFTTIGHPLLTILNYVEHLTMFLPVQGTPKTPVQRAIELLIQQATTTSPTDLPALNAIVQRLTDVQQHIDGQWQTSIEQVICRCTEHERLRLARQETRAKLNATFAQQLVHPVIADLIIMGWRVLLQIIWLREGESGPNWQNYWHTLLDLHHMCRYGAKLEMWGHPTPPDHSEAHIAKLLQTVRAGLSLTGLDLWQRKQLERRLTDTLHLARLQSPCEQIPFVAILPAPEEPVTVDYAMSNHPTSSFPDDQNPAWVQAIATVNELSIGVDLQLRQGTIEQRLRLVWRSCDGQELVFIDPTTFKSKTLERLVLAKNFYDNTVKVTAVAYEPLVSRTTDATIEEIQNRILHNETHDPLTGLSNRSKLTGVVTQLLTSMPNQAIVNSSPIANVICAYTETNILGIVDIDRFAAMTDVCGYSASEQLLVTVANHLKHKLTPVHPLCLAYLGGSRFGFLLSQQSMEVAQNLGRDICVSLGSTTFHWRKMKYPLSCSIGLVAILKPNESPESLLSAADIACTMAQLSGGKVVLFQEGDAGISQHQKRMHDWIQAEAVVRGQRLRLRGQPISPTMRPMEKPHHYEILLSVYDEQGKQLPLDNFIAAAEAFNLMIEIDRLVLNKAIEWVHQYPQQARAFGGIAINLSGQSLGDTSLVGVISAAMQQFAIPPELISFEVTETTAIANLDRAAAIIMSIKKLGCHFALDDFGAGMSSYSYLKRLPVDYIKIDGAFIKDILRSPEDQIIVKSINEVAHFMGKQTIAEYVENLEILQKLQEMGIDYVQGYVVGKPKFLDEVS